MPERPSPAAWRPESAYGFKGTNDGTLAGSLETLGLWEKKPEAVVELYTAIYQALATSPEASFATVAGDETVQALCREQGVTHFGGPMLGRHASHRLRDLPAPVGHRGTGGQGSRTQAARDAHVRRWWQAGQKWRLPPRRDERRQAFVATVWALEAGEAGGEVAAAEEGLDGGYSGGA